jgi:electron transfer flavoprotein alpha subunit
VIYNYFITGVMDSQTVVVINTDDIFEGKSDYNSIVDTDIFQNL